MPYFPLAGGRLILNPFISQGTKTQVNKIEGFNLIDKNKIKSLKDQFPELFHNNSKRNNKGLEYSLITLYNYIM